MSICADTCSSSIQIPLPYHSSAQFATRDSLERWSLRTIWTYILEKGRIHVDFARGHLVTMQIVLNIWRRQGDKKLLGRFLWYWVRGIFGHGGIFCFIFHFQNFSFDFLSWLKRDQKIVMAFSPFKLLGSLFVSERQKSLYVTKWEERGNVKKALRYTKT